MILTLVLLGEVGMYVGLFNAGLWSVVNLFGRFHLKKPRPFADGCVQRTRVRLLFAVMNAIRSSFHDVEVL